MLCLAVFYKTMNWSALESRAVNGGWNSPLYHEVFIKIPPTIGWALIMKKLVMAHASDYDSTKCFLVILS